MATVIRKTRHRQRPKPAKNANDLRHVQKHIQRIVKHVNELSGKTQNGFDAVQGSFNKNNLIINLLLDSLPQDLKEAIIKEYEEKVKEGLQ